MKIREFIQTNKRQILAIVLGAVLLYLPQLLVPRFGLLNDGWYINMSQSVGLSDLSSLALFHTGRLIPFTLLFYDALLTITGHSAFCLTVVYALELTLLGILIYGLVKRYATKFQSVLAAYSTLFTASFVTNFYEFFTQDHISLVLLLLFTYLYFSKKTKFDVALSCFVLLFFLITKETNVFMVGVFGGMLVWNYLAKKSQKTDVVYFILSLFVTGIFLAKRSAFDVTLESGYSVGNIFPTMISYIKLLHFNLILAALVLWKFLAILKTHSWKFASFSKEHVWFLLVGLGSFAIYLPWGAAADRYMIISVVMIMILFFALHSLDKTTKVLNALVALTIAANVFFVQFHIVRFYGARLGDAALLEYLVDHEGEYDQVCVQSAMGSPEDVLQLNLWINKIYKLNVKVCSLSKITEEGLQYYFDTNQIAYHNAVQITDTTLFIRKDHSGVISMPIADTYNVEILKTVGQTLPNVHPTRGFEYKHFNWDIGIVTLK